MHQDLFVFFKYQLRVKIRSDRKCLIVTDFNERWVTEVSLVCMDGASLDFLLSLLDAMGQFPVSLPLVHYVFLVNENKCCSPNSLSQLPQFVFVPYFSF